MVKKLCAFLPSNNLKNFLESRALPIVTENTLTILRFLQNKAKECCAEFLKFSIAGLNLVLCLLPRVTTHTQFKMNSSWKVSQQTSLQKASTKLEAGSTLWWLFQLQSRGVHLSKTWLLMVSFWQRMAARCQRVKRTIPIRLISQTNLALMLADFIFATAP